MKTKKNKKGGSKILTMYWFVIVLIIAGGIFAMVYSFYNHPYDVRELEGEIMINSIADCLSGEGKMNDELFEEEEFSESFKTNILEKCHINLEVEEVWQENFDVEEEIWQGNPQYYFKIDFYNASNLNVPVFDISEGDKNLVADCNIQEEKKYKRTARCVEDDFFSFNKDNGDLYLIKILSAVKKTEKNVK
jgi:hypothetical protein